MSKKLVQTNCSVENCNNTIFCKGYCSKHYKQYWRHGEILEKTIYDSNDIIKHENYAEIVLRDKKGNIVSHTKIDLEDVEKCSSHKWFLENSSGYAICRSQKLRLHTFLMNCPEGYIVDHINHDKLDNRKENLRICSSSQNNMNKDIQSNNTSGYPGVSWRKDRGKWRAFITVNSKQISLGNYILKEDAIKARKEAEIKYFGEYRNKNL